MRNIFVKHFFQRIKKRIFKKELGSMSDSAKENISNLKDWS